MKRILLAMMLGIGALGFAQSDKEIVQKYIVDKIKGYKPTDLVPYSKDGEDWALMDVKSRKVLTDYVLSSPRTFDPTLYSYVDINGQQEYIRISLDYRVEREPVAIDPPAAVQTVDPNNPAFQVEEKRKIKVDKVKYKYAFEPILHKEEYYAVASKKDNSRALINEKGEELEGFHFEMMEEIRHYKDKESGETIFYVEGFDGKKGLVTISGKKKLYGELLQDVYNGVLGYIVQKDGEDTDEIKKSGIVDIITQEWLIKPQEKYKIYDIIYTSSEALNIWRSSVEDRGKANIYFLATDQSGQHFVLDIKGNPILPKN
jgi:hypothetical protein